MTLAHYEGPLDLLLDLIRRQQINISDIPIASITGQYMAYLHQAAELDIELSADFVYMAATLIQIKSRLLLPRDPELDRMAAAEEDPRQELVSRLIQHERFKHAAEMLQQKRLIEEAVWSNPPLPLFAALDADEGAGVAVSLFDLVKTLQQVVERVKSRPVYEVDKEDVTVPDMIRYLRDLLDGQADGMVPAAPLFLLQRSRRARICLFLAILELVKRQAVSFEQAEAFGAFALRRRRSPEGEFEATEMSEGDLALAGQEYQ